MMSSRDTPHECMDALVEEVAKMIEGKAYRRYMHPYLSMRQRARLWALRSQALFGDAPSGDVLRKAKQGQKDNAEDAQKNRLSLVTPESSVGDSSVPHWYQFTERLYFAAWTSLRGKMTQQVAAEMLCTDFFYLVRAHSVAPMLPVLESALSRARAKAAAAAAVRSTGTTSPPRNHLFSTSGFYIRGSHGDPVVIALLWLCRAHCIPCVVDFEPLSFNLPQNGDVQFLVKFMANSAVITDPLAAFILCVELYMPQSAHWLGMIPPSHLHTSHANRAVGRSAWMEYMQHVLTDLRLPLLRFMREMMRPQEKPRGLSEGVGFLPQRLSWRSNRKCDSVNLLHQRGKLIKAFGEALTRFENSACHYYKMRQHKAISVAELCVAAYAFVISTNPLCRELFPPVETVPTLTRRTGVQRDSCYGAETRTITTTTTPFNTSALLSGVPPRYQVIAAQILHATSANGCDSSTRIRVGGTDNGCEHTNNNSSGSAGNGLLCFDKLWNVAPEGSSDAAIEVISRFIRATCQPLRHRLWETLSYAWRAANEQCVGFPFLVLDKNFEDFVTTPTTHAQHGASLCERDAITKIGACWHKLRVAFGAPSFSAERRTYFSLSARL